MLIQRGRDIIDFRIVYLTVADRFRQIRNIEQRRLPPEVNVSNGGFAPSGCVKQIEHKGGDGALNLNRDQGEF